MSNSFEQPEENVNLEQSLRSLAPRSAGLDRDALMFAAGRQAAQSSQLRHGSIAISILVSITLGFAAGRITYPGAVQIATEPAIKPTEPSIDVDPSDAIQMAESAAALNSYLVLNELVPRDSIDAVNDISLSPESDEPATPHDEVQTGDLEGFLNLNPYSYR